MKVFSTILVALILWACNSDKPTLLKIEGEAQGTTYHISYIAPAGTEVKAGTDSILLRLDSSLSTYMPASIISRINNNEHNVRVDDHFTTVLRSSNEVSERTSGLFDVTIAPLVNAWGFGPKRKEKLDTLLISSLKNLVGYKKVKIQGDTLVKEQPGMKLDFNAIAQGYSVDVLSNYLLSKGIENFLVELGGELAARGLKLGEKWKVGIDKPVEKAGSEHEIEAIITLNNKALCTSGNYRKFYEEGGQKFSHIIDPLTGYPAKQNILSATVLANDATTADAYATAFMIMGLKKAKKFLETNKDLNLLVFFIFDENGTWNTYSSPELQGQISKKREY